MIVRAGAMLLLLAGGAFAAAPSAAEIFGHEVRPILEAKCLRCHGDEKTKGGLSLATFAAAMKGGTSGPALAAGRSAESLLIQQIVEGEMPPEGEPAVTPAELAVLRRWIDRAEFPDPAAIAALATAAVHDRAKTLWSFQPVRRPEPPAVRAAARGRTPVDAFVLAKLESAGRTLSPAAAAPAQIRRVTYDLTGLPPTPEEIDAFVADAARDPDAAWRALVERLLASPRYGERWGRHWLDVAGWSESSSSVSDPLRPGHWRYRDWVIRAFNADLPYDRFVREQLAGDELAEWREMENFDDATIDRLVATGFLRSTPDPTDNQFIKQDDKMFAAQQAAVEVATKALLGLTLNCVRCHDHKYDPITQDEYYGLIALFQPAYDPEKWVAGALSKYGAGPIRAIPLRDRAGRAEFERELVAMKAESDRLVFEKMTGLPNRFRDRHLRAQLDALPVEHDRALLVRALDRPERERTAEEHAALEGAARHLGLDADRLLELFPEMRPEIDALKKKAEALNQRGMEVGEVLWALYDVSTEPTLTRFLVRGDFKTPDRAVAPGILRALDRPDAPWRAPEPDAARRTTGRRLAFADWIARADHPLTARVMANRVWHYHFGTGLVATPDDFGVRGARPTHPELLDWLAAEFVASGWSVKHLHRLVVNSATYRQAAPDADAAHAAADYGAFPRRRLEAEAIRDAMLSVAGLLDLTAGGPSVPTAKAEDGSYDVKRDHPGRFRRSVYLSTRRSQLPTLLTLFDAPVPDTNWPHRHDSAIAPQSLALMHHPLVLECAEAFARRLLAGDDTDAARIDRAHRLAFGRAATAEEQALLGAHLATAGPARDAAWRTVAHALLGASEFFYLD